MATINGTIEAYSNKFGKHSILVNENWYSSQYEIKANKGDSVTFETPDGKKYVNKLKVVGSGGGSSSAQPAPQKSSGGFSRGTFPVPPRDGSRSIIRQNSLTNAVKLVTTLEIPKGMDVTSHIIEIAKEFEAYSSGDMDMEAAKAKVEAGFDPEA